MYKIKWDINNNGVLLDDKISEKEAITPPRPVFHEELDLLGLNRYWNYGESETPLMWAIGRKYFYCGEEVAEAKGGNIYEKPEITVHYKGDLKPIDISQVIKNNRNALFTIENEAMDFVEHVHKVYRKKVDYFSVAYSGGKDSQVILDIVSRVLAPEDYVIIFSDTGMEIPFTHDNVKKTISYYKQLYPHSKFFSASPPYETEKFWARFGPPSRIQRWCCTVCKTAPFANLIRSFPTSSSDNEVPDVLVFEGVRGDESENRKKYSRITTDTKSMRQINAEVILSWNPTEVFLYIFSRELNLNRGYRYGLSRIGCAVCPYGSRWSEYILNRIAPDTTSKFIEIIKSTCTTNEGSQDEGINSYIKDGQWKKRAGGRNLSRNGTGIDIIQQNDNLQGVLRRPNEDFFEWLKTIGEEVHRVQEKKTIGEIKINKETFPYIYNRAGDSASLLIKNLGKDIVSMNKVKKILYKATFCIHCGACEAECPTGALSFNPRLRIDDTKCVHCSQCLNYVEKGCLVAKSIRVTEKGANMASPKVATSKYQTFGLRGSWLKEYLNTPETFLTENIMGLGNRQIESMVAWLKDGEMMSSGKLPTGLANVLSKAINTSEKLVWEVLWTNFYYNIPIIQWYLDNVDWMSKLTSKELTQLIINYDERNKERTTANTVNSLISMFENSPVGSELKLGVINKEKNIRHIYKMGSETIDIISIVYCLYKYAENTNCYDQTVSMHYQQSAKGGPYKLFGVSRNKLEDFLRGAQEKYGEILRVEISADLDNIFLEENVTPLEALQEMLN